MKSIRTKQVVRQVALEEGLTLEQVTSIIVSPFEMQAMIMKNQFNPSEDSYPMIRIPNFGIFSIPETYQKYFKAQYGFISNEEQCPIVQPTGDSSGALQGSLDEGQVED